MGGGRRRENANRAFQTDRGIRVLGCVRTSAFKLYPSSKGEHLGPRKAKRRLRHVSHQMSTMDTQQSLLKVSRGSHLNPDFFNE